MGSNATEKKGGEVASGSTRSHDGGILSLDAGGPAAPAGRRVHSLRPGRLRAHEQEVSLPLLRLGLVRRLRLGQDLHTRPLG